MERGRLDRDLPLHLAQGISALPAVGTPINQREQSDMMESDATRARMRSTDVEVDLKRSFQLLNVKRQRQLQVHRLHRGEHVGCRCGVPPAATLCRKADHSNYVVQDVVKRLCTV